MRTIGPKIFVKLDFFCRNVSNGCWIFCIENILSISDILPTCLAYPLLKILENWKNKYDFFRMKDNLVVLP